MKFKAIYFLLLLFVSFAASAQTSFDPNQQLSVEQLIEDVDFYIKTLDEVHINPYTQISARELRAQAEGIKSQIRKQGAMTQKEFWLLFTPLVSALQDSHSFVVDPRFFIKAENDPTKYFPVRTVYIDGKIVVKESFADEKIDKGTVISAVNGIKAKEIIRRLSDYRFGVAREKVETAVQWLWVGAAEVFGRPDEFTILFSDGRKIQVKGLSLPEFIKRENAVRSASLSPTSEPTPLKLKFLGDGIAYLDSSSFSYDLEKYKELLKDVFTQIKSSGTKKLIIDMRNNSGGNSALGDALIDMFNAKPYRHYSMRWKRSEQYVEEMKRKKIGIPDDYLRMRQGEIYSTDSSEVKSGDNPLRFTGEVYVLSAKETFSSGQMFLAVVKDNRLAKIIGEETSEPACSFGEIYFFNLPNSKLRTSLSVKYWIPPAGCNSIKGVVPDITVERSISDYVTGRDAILEAALNLFNRKVN